MGILGALLMGSGDWLLGYVDPTTLGSCPLLRAEAMSETMLIWFITALALPARGKEEME